MVNRVTVKRQTKPSAHLCHDVRDYGFVFCQEIAVMYLERCTRLVVPFRRCGAVVDTTSFVISEYACFEVDFSANLAWKIKETFGVVA